MKPLLLLVLIVGVAAFTYRIHQDRVNEAAANAAASARAATSSPKVEKPHTVSLSHPLEPQYLEVFSPLDPDKPEDLTVPLGITRERILDKSARVALDERPVYGLAADFVGVLVDVAAARTRALEAMLKAGAGQSSLDGRNASNPTNTFFAQTVARRWEDEKRRLKPRAEQSLAKLRNAEREWNQRIVDAKALVDSFDAPRVAAPNVARRDTSANANPLERDAYNNRRAMLPPRRVTTTPDGYPR